VPVLGDSPLPRLHLPVSALPDEPLLRAEVVGAMRVTVVAPPHVLGWVTWLATPTGWLALEPAEVRTGVRWAVVRPVRPDEIGTAVAPLLAGALA
jgi:hypothetical protein